MSAMEWAVLLAGMAAIAGVNWYFFFAEQGAKDAGREAVEEEVR